MIGGAASTFTALGAMPGAITPPPATGEAPAAGFGAILGALGAIGESAAPENAVIGCDAPTALPAAIDASPESDILAAMATVTEEENGVATAAPGTTSPAVRDAAPMPPAAPLVTIKPANDAKAAGTEAGQADLAGSHPIAAARLVATPARAGRTDVATGLAAEDADPALSVIAGKKDQQDGDSQDTASPVPGSVIMVAGIDPVAGSPIAPPTGEITPQGGEARTVPVGWPPAPAPKAIAADASADIPAPAVKLPQADFVLPDGALAANDATAIPPPALALPAMSGEAATDLPDASMPQTKAADGAVPPDMAPRQQANLAAMPAVTPPAFSGRPVVSRDPAPADEGGVIEAPAPASAIAASAPAAFEPHQPAPSLPGAMPAPAPAASAVAVPAPANVEQVVMGHHLDLARDSAWLDQLARDIVATAAGDSQLRFRLNPEHLGSLHVELIRHDDGAAVRMTTESEAARAMLADAQGRLVAEARSHGMRITETSVDLGRNGGGGEGGQRGWGDAQSGQSGQSNPQSRQRLVNASVTMSTVNGDRTEARPARRDLYA